MLEALKNTAKNAVGALLTEGADKASVSVYHTVTHEFNVDGGQFSLMRTLFNRNIIN